MTRSLNETPSLRWFREENFNCRQCGKRGHGTLMGDTNESYGIHCNTCAEKRLKASEKVRNEMREMPE